MDLADQLRLLKAEGVGCAEFHETGALKSVQFWEPSAEGKPLRIVPGAPVPKDALRDGVLGDGPPDVEFDQGEALKVA